MSLNPEKLKSKLPDVNIALAKNIHELTGDVTPANGFGRISKAHIDYEGLIH